MGRGKLVFKGEEKAKKARKSNSKKPNSGRSSTVASTFPKTAENGLDGSSCLSGAAAMVTAAPKTPIHEQQEQHAPEPPKVHKGQGLISTSGKVVTGHGTSFQSCLRVGDAILARTSTTTNNKSCSNQEEMRIVTMVLSPISISISSPFSVDFKTPAPYSYINKPRDIRKEKATKERMAKEEKEEVERRAMGTYYGGANNGEVVYREKTENGSYRIRREKMDTSSSSSSADHISRSDLLAIRAKKKSDRYC